MTKNRATTMLVAALLLNLLANSVSAQVNVTTYHNDNARTGQNTQETVLTTSNVNASSFGLLFTVGLDAQAYVQPLVLSNLAIGGGTHNVVYVATQYDSVYAIDADTGGAPYWHVSFPNPAPEGSGGINCNNIEPWYGITSTPVIDPNTGTIYVVPQTKENGSYVYRLHALDVLTGAEKFGGPVQISASVGGITFTPAQQMNRPALLLENGHIIMAWGSHCDNPPYYGWIMSYNASTLAQETVRNIDPQGTSGLNAGIWMSGGGVAADAGGSLFLATGNGDYNGSTDFGCSIIKLGFTSGGFTLGDWFTPQGGYSQCSGNDKDLGSGGVLLLPDQPAGETYRHLLVGMGKLGTLYLVNRDGMGHYTDNIVQEISGATVGVWGSPAYWNGNVYYGSAYDGGSSDYVKAFSLTGTTPQLTLTSHTPEKFSYPTPTPSVSSNGTSNGIVWVLDNAGAYHNGSGPAVLHAYSATNLSSELFTSSSYPWNQAGPAVKFSVPTIANGKVYVGGQGQLSVYGLLPCTSTPQCFGSGQFFSAVETLSCSQTHNISTEAQACYQSCNTGYGASGNLTYSSANAQNNAFGGAYCNLYWSIDGHQYSTQLSPQ